ncbi:MAG: pseudouridine synthase [Planctomycetes bacterium]|nr:pseudouridine synthase [Planctomycetota bacterium]
MDHDHESPDGKVRLQRVLADAGVAARRVCERMIEEGRVTVNGEVVRRLPVFVDPEHDRIVADGHTVGKPERRLYVMLNKPERVLVTSADEPEFNRATVMQLVDHPAAGRLFPVGRLDYESCGLVLLTNDGELTNRLTHPRYGVTKTYEVMVKGRIDAAAAEAVLVKLRATARREQRMTGPDVRVKASSGNIEVGGVKGDNTVLRVTLREARNREIREVLKSLGMPVKKLTRVAIGPLELKGLAPGQWRELTREEVQDLRRADRARSAQAGKPNQKAGASRRRPPAAGRPGRRPGSRPASGPDARPGARPDSRSGSRPGSRQGSRDGSRSGPREGGRGGKRPGRGPSRSGNR